MDIYILPTVLFTSPLVQTRRICLTIMIYRKINDLFLEEDRRKILGGSLGFQGKRKGGSVIANRVESED